MTTRKPIVLISGVLQELNAPTDNISIAGNTTTDLPEGTNLYYTDARSRGALSVTGGSGLTYDSGTGAFGVNTISLAGNTTTNLPEGTNLYYTDARARGALSVSVGSGLTYDSGTGIFGTSAIPNGQLANSSITLGSTSISLGSTATTIAGLLSLTSDAIQVGTVDGANSILLNSSGITFEGATPDSYETTLAPLDPTADRTVSLPDETGVLATQEFASAIAIALG